jgi:hypothetical protein
MKQQRPVLFLDIDGVMKAIPAAIDSDAKTGFTVRAISGLREIVSVTDCEIVISSSWREDNLPALNRAWELHGLEIVKSRIIGETPLLDRADEPTREDEIDKWLSDHHFKGRMAILDDEMMQGDLRPWQVLTFQETGMTSLLAQMAVRLLTSGPLFG